jgi:hypothetical protein
MTVEDLLLFPMDGPDSHGMIGGCGYNMLAIRGKSNRVHTATASSERYFKLARAWTKKDDRAII